MVNEDKDMHNCILDDRCVISQKVA